MPPGTARIVFLLPEQAGTGPERTSDTRKRTETAQGAPRGKIPSKSPIPRELPLDPHPHGWGAIPNSPKAILPIYSWRAPRRMRGASSQSQMSALLPFVRPRTRSPARLGQCSVPPVPPAPTQARNPRGSRSRPQALPVSQSGLMSPVDDFLRPPLGATHREGKDIAFRPPGALPALSPAVTPASAVPSRSSGAGSPIAVPLRGHCCGHAGLSGAGGGGYPER